jgi:hypothetical protein
MRLPGWESSIYVRAPLRTRVRCTGPRPPDWGRGYGGVPNAKEQDPQWRRM